MEGYIKSRKQKIILLDGQFEKQIKELNIYIDELLETTNEDIKEDLAWAYYWLARATYRLNINNAHMKFKEIENALKQSLEYKGLLTGNYKALICWFLGNLYKKVCANDKYDQIERLYLESARYYKKSYDDMNDAMFLRCYSDIYNNLANLTKEEKYIEESLKHYKILLNNKVIDDEYMQDVYETAYEVYNYNGNKFKANYYFNKITDVEILHNIKLNSINTNEIG